jgi:ABC-2 type transport system permease protein
MESQLQYGRVRGMLVIGSDFSATIQRQKKPAHIQLVTDGTEPNTASFLASYLQSSLHVWLAQRSTDRRLPVPSITSLEPRYWFNPTTISRNFLVPGSITVIMTVIGALLTSLVVAREWERGTMEVLLATRATRGERLLSKIIPYYILGTIAMTLCVLVATLLFDIPFRGSFWVLFIVSSLFLGSGLGLGLFLSTVMRNQFAAAQIALITAFLPATMLSGFIFEIKSMPATIQAITYFVPARYFVNVLQTLFLGGNIWPVILLNSLFLILLALFWLGLTAIKTAHRLD